MAKRQRVLLVDDDEVLAEVTAHLLEDEGYEVEVTPDADTALGRVAADRFDAAVIDVHLRGTNGPTLARTVRQLRLDVRLVLVSGLPIARCDAEVADVVLMKPYKLPALLAAISPGARALGGNGSDRVGTG